MTKGYTKMKSDPQNKPVSQNHLYSDDNYLNLHVVSWVCSSPLKRFLFLLLCLSTGGIFYILCVLNQSWKNFFAFSSCSPHEAEGVIVLQNHSHKRHQIKRRELDGKLYLCLEIDCKRYWTSESVGWKFQSVSDVPNNFSKYLKPSHTLSTQSSREEMNLYYGDNKMELPKASFFDIVSVIMFHPFYLFQYFAVVLWMSQDYVFYSIVILFITGGAIYLTTSETVFNLQRLHDLAGISTLVSRIDPSTGASIQTLDTSLVPGDQIILKQNTSLPCDLILLTGRVSVDESMLTGESIPVNKSPIDHSIFMSSGSSTDVNDQDAMAITRQTGSILYSGTKILVAIPPTRSTKPSPLTLDNADQFSDSLTTRGSQCIGVVYRTGFRSTKGQLISTLLNPTENFMSFFSDALYVIMFMGIMCTCLYIWSAVYLLGNNASWKIVGLKYLDALTIAVPPGLTASLTVATGIAVGRLKAKGIFVSESTRVNWAGIISAACFDKTGTLTEERLHFKGVCMPSSLLNLVHHQSKDNRKDRGSEEILVSSDSSIASIPLPMVELMGTCHALSFIDQVPVGDPLEVELFRAVGYSLTPTGEHQMDVSMNSSLSGSKHDHSAIRTIFAAPSGPTGSQNPINSNLPISTNQKYRILKHYEFTSERLRAGSLVQRPNKDIIYYCKGSPEAILKLVKPESIPADLQASLASLSKRGYRVIASCFRVIARESSSDSVAIQKFQSIPQSEIEKDCSFLGLIFLSNALKSDTLMTINTLRAANIPCNMITGDHIYTAIAIGTDCGLLIDGIDVNIVDEDENSATGIQITSLLSGAIVSYNLGEFLTLLQQFKDNSNLGNLNPSTIASGQIAVSGRGLEVVKKRYSDYLPLLLESTQVFARMKPTDKQFIVQEMQKSLDHIAIHDISERSVHSTVTTDSCTTMRLNVALDSPTHSSKEHTLTEKIVQFWSNSGKKSTYVLFCGDGANDMAALRAATVGVSLCEAETSVAAPITSKFQTPGAVVDVIQEGRCSLITAYVLVGFNIMYATIQLFNAIMMYHYGLLVGNNTYLIQDLFFTLFLGLAISVTPPSLVLGKDQPPHRFFTPHLFIKLLSQLICFPLFQIFSLHILSQQPWYVRYNCQDDPLRDTVSYETSVIAHIGLAQLMIASVVSCIDEPYRQSWYTNRYHLIALFGQGIFVLYQIFGRESYFMGQILEIKPLPIDFCWTLISIIFANGLVSGMLCWLIDRVFKR